MRTLLRLLLIALVLGGLGLMAYVSIVEIPNESSVQMIDIPPERYEDRL